MGLSPGARLGPYEVVAPLGAGGMGEVWRARDTRLGRDVAIKVLPEEFFEDKERRGRFEREARLLAAVTHPNIAVIYSFEEVSGRFLLVQELLEGESLREKVGTPLPPRRAVEWALQIAHGLAAAHEKGIVHRDLKPENLFVTKDGQVKILDFGVAKLLPSFDSKGVDTETPTETATQPGTAMGTVAYMSPEQIRGQPVDARTDLFSFGVVLYEMLSGKRPFQRETAAETMAAALREEPPDISETNRSVAAPLEDVVRHCLEKDPEGRFQSARDVVFALEALPEVSSAKPIVPMSPAGVWLHRHRMTLAGAAVVLILVSLGAIVVSRQRAATSKALPSVLALPCKVYGAPDVEFLTDAVPGTISTFLSQVEGLDTKVPPTSLEVEKVKGDLTKLADLYQVSSFIVTSITTSPDRFALNVQLVDATTRKVRWGRQFEGAREAYNDLARQAAEGIRTAIRPSTAPVPTATVSSEAELAFRQGSYFQIRFHNDYKRPDFDAALAAYEKAFAIAPTFADAAGRIAFLYPPPSSSRDDFESGLRQAESWALRALSIDPRCGIAWAARSNVEIQSIHADPEKGIDYAVKAVAFSPEETFAHIILGMWLGSPGTYSLFVASNLTSFYLDPLYVWPALNASAGLCLLGRPEEALRLVEKASQVEPDNPGVLTFKGFALLRSGRLKEAEDSLRQSEAGASTMGPDSGYLWQQIKFQLAVAQRDAATSETLARQVLDLALSVKADANLLGNATMFAVSPLARMGRTDDAIRILEKSVEAGAPPTYDWILLDPDLRPLRGNPRFEKVLVASRGGAAMVARVLGESRRRGELPKYLEGPLDDLFKLLNEERAKS